MKAKPAEATKSKAEGLIKQGWTRQEDETILRTVQTTGMKWSAIAAVLPGRTDDAVRNRYLRLQRKKGGLAIGAHVDGGMTVQVTDQAKRGDMWTSEEDTQIMAAVATHGLKWQEIAHGLPGRSANAVRNRYLRLHTPTGTVGASGGGYNSPSASMGAQFLQELAAAAHARQETQETSDAALCAQRDAAAHAAAMQAAEEAQTAQYAAEFAATQRYVRPAATPTAPPLRSPPVATATRPRIIRLRRILRPGGGVRRRRQRQRHRPRRGGVRGAGRHPRRRKLGRQRLRLQRRLAEPGWHGVRRRERRHRARHRARRTRCRAVGVRARRRRRRTENRVRSPRAGGCAPPCRRLPRRRWLAGKSASPTGALLSAEHTF